jgi:hypothetical protein
MAEVGKSFSTVIEALASKEEVKQLSAAILLRRFFDPKTEYGIAGTPYATEAVNVIASMLRSETLSQKMQKLLADGLAYAPDLRHADLQKANLTDAYLGKGVDCSGADFFCADLTRASLQRLTGVKTVFYGATLHKTVLAGADLRGANFKGADLQGVEIDPTAPFRL